MVKTKQFYKNIGKKGGQAKVRKGFAWMGPARRREVNREANRKGWAAGRAKEAAKMSIHLPTFKDPITGQLRQSKDILVWLFWP
jgi:hypothetical protein